MSYKLSFDKYAGRSLEWLFFNRPRYVEWMIDEGIDRQEHCMDDVDGDHFREMCWRASNVGGTCCQCKKRPVTRMGLSTHHRSGAVGAVGFYCDECEYLGGTSTGYYTPSSS